ncbi:hypothetical protein Gotur_035616 [Gossypium turneri]
MREPHARTSSSSEIADQPKKGGVPPLPLLPCTDNIFSSLYFYGFVYIFLPSLGKELLVELRWNRCSLPHDRQFPSLVLEKFGVRLLVIQQLVRSLIF